ncbi:hypothetical protein [Moorena producens]|uniref:hypothetical protein n=1 Tax=Moorena producens TaxID=1155739 RepID=UPI001314B3F4|nr:hypothetical protein [Moorena producens]
MGSEFLSTLPCSLFPVSCSLFPVPCSLFPVPCSLFPELQNHRDRIKLIFP